MKKSKSVRSQAHLPWGAGGRACRRSRGGGQAQSGGIKDVQVRSRRVITIATSQCSETLWGAECSA